MRWFPPLDRAHLPTGRIAVEEFLRIAITEFGAHPRRDGWEEILERTQAATRTSPTWPAAPTAIGARVLERTLVNRPEQPPFVPKLVRFARHAAVVGLYLNAYPLRFNGEVELWRIPRGENDAKRAREGQLGLALWAEREAFWSVRRPDADAAASRRMPAAEPRGRVLFAAREAIVDHAQDSGREAWFARAGEMHCLGLLASQNTDRFVLEPQLVMRLVQEPYLDADAAVVVRARTRWRCAGTLADVELQRLALGEPAIRLAGDGPRRGHVEAVASGELRLRTGDASLSVAPADYALVAGSRLVVAYRGQQVLRELQIASGVLTVSNRRNRYAVKDRFQLAGRMLRNLSWPIPLPGGGQMELGSPIELQMENPT